MDSPFARCFIALVPDAATRARLAAQPIPGTARPVDPADLHMTLAFLGRISAPQAEALSSALPVLAAPLPPLAFDTLELWPQPGRPRVFVAAYARAPEVRAMHESLSAILRQLDLPVEGRPFRPHVTLARFAPRAPAALPPAAAATLPARLEALALYASLPLARGPRYKVLARAQLARDLTAAAG